MAAKPASSSGWARSTPLISAPTAAPVGMISIGMTILLADVFGVRVADRAGGANRTLYLSYFMHARLTRDREPAGSADRTCSYGRSARRGPVRCHNVDN